MAEAIREVVATAVLFEVADPRVHSVTVLRVELSGDLRQAKVYVSIMGTESERRRALEGLNHAAGFIQARVAARLQTRFTPVLGFRLDETREEVGRDGAPDRRGGRLRPEGGGLVPLGASLDTAPASELDDGEEPDAEET